ncbi:hypothetical protein [Streptomyces sp. ISL-98]|uniref:hypothetical protein n=1 Tax=Streptomyces sp. ISL-98 TaxID=2819192 RepID=UPI0020356971|nr:hypothetical protein [Streptomyces sp. ISL-98]
MGPSLSATCPCAVAIRESGRRGRHTPSSRAGARASATLRGQDATLERLRVDRQLDEALTHGPDPLHLAEVFGLDEKTAMGYAASARALLEQVAEAGTVS